MGGIFNIIFPCSDALASIKEVEVKVDLSFLPFRLKINVLR